jgi:DNA-directed RNA polymerase subunit alpha
VATDSALAEQLCRPITTLNLSARAANCLEAARINTVRDLVIRTEAELLRFRNFGKNSLHEVHRKLADLGLSLGLNLTDEAGPAEAGDLAEISAIGPDSSALDQRMEAFTMGD